ncbi:thiosulfate sulfurtransferase GlpE [Pokkaliibacter sp. CJK22405]|uniref:thiosulfate sulfurtransferase GlpE n=1 Tax=Pokkaliibacter sp. CJK22405 TaxID=3384615 RepID=UPI003984BD1C
MSYTCISAEQAKAMISSGAQIADVRDPASFSNGHIPGAVALSNETLQDFLQDADPDQPWIVVCYHGHSSQGAASYLAGQGFDDIYSMDGGFELWRQLFPDMIETGKGE